MSKSDFSNYGALQTLRWTVSATPDAPPSLLYIQLHTGDPGADGTLSPAGETRRQSALFSAPVEVGADGRAQAVTAADAIWVAVSDSETYSHISLWDDPTAGNCWYKGAMLAPVPIATGSNFTFPAGSTLDHS